MFDQNLVSKADRIYRKMSSKYKVFDMFQDEFVTKLEELDGNYRFKRNGVWMPESYEGQEIRDEVHESLPCNDEWSMYVYCDVDGETVFEAFPKSTEFSKPPLDSRVLESDASGELQTNIKNSYAITGENLSWEEAGSNLQSSSSAR